MKPAVLMILMLLLPWQQTPTVDREEPDVSVVKFSWSKYRANNDLIRGASDPGPSLNEPVSLQRSPPKNEPQEVRNRRDIQERRAQLAIAEKNAANSANSGRQQDYFALRLELKNVGTSTLKSIVWEVQPEGEPADHDLRQYVCAWKSKPNDHKTFELLSPSAPLKVVNADKKSKYGKVVINRIEYADGSVWKRKGWSILIPAEMTDEMGNGKCMMF